MPRPSGTPFRGGNFEFRFAHERITWSVRNLILANIAIFALCLLIDAALAVGQVPTDVIREYFAFSTSNVIHGYVWTIFTYMFLHAGLGHLFFNMLSLYFFGPDVERVLGTRQFLRFYVICGAVGVLANFLTPSGLVIGASGATLGVLVAFAIIDPERQVFMLPIPVPINARALVIIFIVINVVSSFDRASPTSWQTHLGGMATGFLYMKFIPKLNEWRRFRRKPPAVPKKDLDKLGEEIDNILKFQDKDRK